MTGPGVVSPGGIVQPPKTVEPVVVSVVFQPGMNCSGIQYAQLAGSTGASNPELMKERWICACAVEASPDAATHASSKSRSKRARNVGFAPWHIGVIP